MLYILTQIWTAKLGKLVAVKNIIVNSWKDVFKLGMIVFDKAVTVNSNRALIWFVAVRMLQMMDRNVMFAFPIAPLFTVVLSLVGK